MADTLHAPLRSLPRFFDNANPQSQSLLFRLPGEIRDSIYNAALSAYEDQDNAYETTTYWARPLYSAPRKSDLALLQTCKQVYREAWFKPWALADHSFWLTSDDRAPEHAIDQWEFSDVLEQIHEQHGDVEIDHVRFFAQMYALEDGSLNEYLDLALFQPKAITITIRHTDWWSWESDEWLRFSSDVPKQYRLPVSVQTFCLEMESLERKKDQVDAIVSQMKAKWLFLKVDGSSLSARDTPVDIQRWRGSSTWAGERWLRDETIPECVEYYVATVKFTPSSELTSENDMWPHDLEPTVKPDRIQDPYASVQTSDLEEAGVPPNTSAKEALAMWMQHDEDSFRCGNAFITADGDESDYYDYDDDYDEDYNDDEQEDMHDGTSQG